MIRDYRGSDYDRVVEIFRQREYEFKLPDLDSPLMLTRKVVVDSDDVVRIAAFARLQVNAYLLIDDTWATPQGRLDSIGMIQDAMTERCRFFGVDEASAQVHPRFARRLKKIGWRFAPGITVARNL